MNGELDSLKSEYEDFAFGLVEGPGNKKCFEAVRTRGDETVSVVVTDDPVEMRAILNAALT